MSEPKNIKMICATCGGDDVRADAYAAWNVDTQEWELITTFDKGSVCEDCGGECRIEEIPYLTRDDLLEMLDNVSAAAENMLTHFRDRMSEADIDQRIRIINEARAVCDAELRSENDETEGV